MVLQPPTAHYTTTHHYYTLQRTINTNNHSATHDGARSDDNRPNADSMTARQHDSGGRDKKQHPTTPAQCAKKIEQRGVGRERDGDGWTSKPAGAHERVTVVSVSERARVHTKAKAKEHAQKRRRGRASERNHQRARSLVGTEPISARSPYRASSFLSATRRGCRGCDSAVVGGRSFVGRVNLP